MIRYEQLRDGSITLEDVFLCNVYLDNEAHNQRVLTEMALGDKNG